MSIQLHTCIEVCSIVVSYAIKHRSIQSSAVEGQLIVGPSSYGKIYGCMQSWDNPIMIMVLSNYRTTDYQFTQLLENRLWDHAVMGELIEGQSNYETIDFGSIQLWDK